MTINEKVIKILKNHSIPLTNYFVLYCISNNLDWYKQIKEDRIGTIQYLTRRKFITSDMQITETGKKLLEGQLVVKKTKKALNSQEQLQEWQENFAEFWKLFPASDKYRHWKRTRALRVNKTRAFKYFCDILDRGEYSYEQIRNALKADIKAKEDSSVIENQFKYMQAITSWLNKGIFEGYISEDIMKDEEEDDRTIYE
jgi:hypothetical protein